MSMSRRWDNGFGLMTSYWSKGRVYQMIFVMWIVSIFLNWFIHVHVDLDNRVISTPFHSFAALRLS